MLRDIASKKMVGASQRRSAVRHLQRRYSASERSGCEVTGTHRSTYRYESVRPSQAALRQKIRDLAQSRMRYGYKRIHILLKREGVHVNPKRVHCLYSEEACRCGLGAPHGLSSPRADSRPALDCGRRVWPGAWTSSVIRPRTVNAFGR